MKDNDQKYIERGERFREAVRYLQDNGHAKTQKDLAEIIGCSTSQITNAIKGKKANMTKQLIWKLNRRFDNIFNENYIWDGNGSLIDQKVDRLLQMVSKSPVPYYIYKERIDELKQEMQNQRNSYESIIRGFKEELSAIRKDINKLLKQK